MHSAQELVSQVTSLVSLPTVYHRIREQLDSPDGSIMEVVRLVAADPALTTGVLRLVNSAFYGFGGQVDSLERAIPILGLQQVHDLVLAMSVSALFEGIRPDHMDVGRFWHGSMMCALSARGLARAGHHLAAERMFVIGLLADLGHMVMYETVPQLADRAQDQADSGDEPLYEAERRIVGCDYAEVGAALMDGWKLPACFAEVIGAQIVPRLGGERSADASLLHIAGQISHADRHCEPSATAIARIGPDLWHETGLDEDAFVRVREESELHLAACISTFFPRLRRH
jgi:HD-like signal output (HDOD) protein